MSFSDDMADALAKAPKKTVSIPVKPSTRDRIIQECDRIKEVLLAKNAQYGDSASKPLRVFSGASPIEQLLVRIDDKLSRIARGNGQGNEDTTLDLIGYLVLLRVVQAENRDAALEEKEHPNES